MSSPRPMPARVPPWLWRAFMAPVTPRENRVFNVDPIRSVDYTLDIDYVGDGIRSHRLDVITPIDGKGALPVYVYFHGGGWTSGDKKPLTKYCASQAASGMVVVNVNYRRAGRFHMRHMLEDANSALRWVRDNIRGAGGDPDRLILGGDSAGGQIAALIGATASRPELAKHYGIDPAFEASALKGHVLHCGALDFSVIFEPRFVMGIGFVRLLLPEHGRGTSLIAAARWLSPIEWLHEGSPPVLVTTSERDFFYTANLNFVEALRRHGVQADTLIFDRGRRNTEHTWQQNSRYPESQEVYARLQAFVRRVAPRLVPARAGI